MHELGSGTTLASRYTLVRRLAAGGGREAWLADDRLSDTPVALKVLVDSDQPAETLRREWQLSIRLMHAHIVRVFEFHDESDIVFYSLQFVDGPDIGVLSAAPPMDVLGPVAALADALRYAHGKGIVHRDIKASNVLLDHNGAAYLVDFGVASVGGEPVGGGSLIAASPQQLDGLAPTPADDVFALGGLIYELVSGRSPYSAENTADDIANLVPPRLVSKNGDTLPAPIIDLVAAMLAKDPAARPTAEAVVDALRAVGIRPGPAPVKYVAKVRAAGDEVIDRETPVVQPRPRQTPMPGAASTESKGGLSSRTVGIALGVLLVLLIGVVFILPRTLTTDRPAVVEEEAAAEASAESSAEEPGTEAEAAEAEPPRRDVRVEMRDETEDILGSLLAKARILEERGVERWGGLPWQRATEAYAAGDEAYLERDYEMAQARYREAIDLVEPLLEQVDSVFGYTMQQAAEALENGDTSDAIRLYDLAVAISPSHGPAQAGLLRAKNLDNVLSLTEQGFEQERDLELDAALGSFDAALELDPEWQPAAVARARVQATMEQMEFDLRMTEGLAALADGDMLGARAAFRMAKQMRPSSPEPADGLLQVEQGIRLEDITALEGDAAAQERDERWQSAVDTYTAILDLDGDLTFAQDGLRRSQQMVALHAQLEGYIGDPDSLSSPRLMQVATTLVIDITRMPDIGPTLAAQRDELSRLLKRASTPLTVQIVSDNATNVSIYKVGRLGNFASTELTLRPGTYVAVGSRPGYRDVRLEFRVAPEIEMQPVVVRCEEQI